MSLSRYRIKVQLPILSWLPSYQKSWLKGDLSAGVTVGIMLIPQGMAYAMIAGLPPVFGLYAALVPQVIYMLLGTSRQLAVGPVAMDSLLVAAGVSTLAEQGTDAYIAFALMLAFMMGLLQVIMGVLRMGFLVNFLSKPVISGFTSAAAVIIGANQLKHLLGVQLASKDLWSMLSELFVQSSGILWVTVLVSGSTIFLLKFLKAKAPKIPAALVVVILSILAAKFGDLSGYGLSIVKDIPAGLPSFQWVMPSYENFVTLFPMALTLSLIAFMEAISVSKAIHARHKDYQLDANQELIALGSANMIGAFFQSYPVTGGFSRTAVNDQAGAKTGVSAFVSALIIGLTLLFFTPLFYHLPHAVLGAIILVAVLGLIDLQYPVFLWKTKKIELLLLLITFIVTLSVGIREGILFGVALSIIVMVYRTTTPHIAVLGRIPDTDEYRNVNRFPDLEVRQDVLVFRYDAQLYFANSNHFAEHLRSMILKKGKALKLIVFNAEAVNALDTTAMYMLLDIVEEINSSGIHFYLSGVKGPVRDLMYKAGITDKLGSEHFFLDIQEALDFYDQKKSPEVMGSMKRANQHNS